MDMAAFGARKCFRWCAAALILDFLGGGVTGAIRGWKRTPRSSGAAASRRSSARRRSEDHAASYLATELLEENDEGRRRDDF